MGLGRIPAKFGVQVNTTISNNLAVAPGTMVDGTRNSATNWRYEDLSPLIMQAELGNDNLLNIMAIAANNSNIGMATRLSRKVMLTGIDLDFEYTPRCNIMVRNVYNGLEKLYSTWFLPNFQIRFWLYWQRNRDNATVDWVKFQELLQYEGTRFSGGQPNNYTDISRLKDLPFFLGPRHFHTTPQGGGALTQCYYNGGLWKTEPALSRPQLIKTWKETFQHKPKGGMTLPNDDILDEGHTAELAAPDVTDALIGQEHIDGVWKGSTLRFVDGESLGVRRWKRRIKLNKILDFSSDIQQAGSVETLPGRFILAYTATMGAIDGANIDGEIHLITQANKLGVTIVPRFYWYDFP